MNKVRFPIESLRLGVGELSLEEFGWSIHLPIEPFDLPDHGEVKTRIEIDCIKLPSDDITTLAGRMLTFPRAPEDDAPEGSVFMGYHHHPVDLLALEFGLLNGGTTDIRFAIGIAFSFEGLSASEDVEYDDIAGEFTATLVLKSAPLRH